MQTDSRYPWGKGTPTRTYDATANDSDKSFTVPAGKIWLLKSIYGQITCTGTAGNRIMGISISDGTNVIWFSPRTGNIAATQTGTVLSDCGDLAYGTTTAVAPLLSGLAPNVTAYNHNPYDLLLAGYVIRVYDIAAVDAAADDLIVVIKYIEYDA